MNQTRMYTRQIATLLHIKQMCDHLRVIDRAILTERERFALDDTRSQLYDRAAFCLVQQMRQQSKEHDRRKGKRQ